MSKLSITLLGILLAIGTVGWSYREENGDTLQQPTLPILTVCPEGPPSCQFRKIQDAINAAPEQQLYPPTYQSGAEIHIAPGIYEENLLIRKSVILKGAGRDKTFLRPSQGGRETYTIILIVRNFSGIEVDISGLTLQDSREGGLIGIEIMGSPLGVVAIHDNRFETFYGILIENTLGLVSIKSNTFIRKQQNIPCSGVMAANVGVMIVLGNEFQGCDIGIGGARKDIPFTVPAPPKPGDRIRIEENRVLQGNIGIVNSAGVIIQNNIIEQSAGIRGSIYVYDSEAVAVQANTVRHAKSPFGIEVQRSEAVVSSNRVEGGARHGVGVVDAPHVPPKASRVQLVSNEIVENDKFGILVSKVEYLISCQGNQVRSNKAGDYGIGMWYDPQPSPELKQKCEGG